MNLAAVLSASAARLPHKPVVTFRDKAIAYRDLDERVARAAGALRGLGLAPGNGEAPGDRVALLVANTPAFVEAFFAILRAGLVAVPLNVGFTRDEIAYILADAGARAIVVAAPFLSTVEAAAAPDLEHVIDTGSWDELVAGGDPLEAVAVADGALALLQYTAGTTGRPKGAMLSHGNLIANHRQMARTKLAIEERDIVLCVLPLFHIYALNVVLAFAVARGATLLLAERFDALETLREVERHRATILVGAPPMYVAWAREPGLDELDLASVRYAVSGAAALPPEVLERFTERFGIPVWEGYGLTETSPVLTTAAMGDAPKPGSVGRPVPDVEARLVDDDGTPVRRGDPGEVVVRGPNVFSGYWRDPEATRQVLDHDGWFRTGDVGYADDEGDLHLVDRKKDLIIVSGFNVYPREVEEVLVRHPEVSQAAVVGAPHPDTGECVKAFVVRTEGASANAADVTAFARRHLARFKVPAEIEFVADLPVLPTGKVRRRELRGGV